MEQYKTYIYLANNNTARLYNVNFNFLKVMNMINKHSIKTGAKVLEEKYLGSISSYENGRIITKMVKRFKRNEKINGLSLDIRKLYIYTIFKDESIFIRTLLNCFKLIENSYHSEAYASLGKSYVLLDFSKLYEMLNNNHLTNEDKSFLKELFNEFTFNTNIGPYTLELIEKQTKKEGIGENNSNLFKKCYSNDNILEKKLKPDNL